jgi:hypothetical protein
MMEYRVVLIELANITYSAATRTTPLVQIRVSTVTRHTCHSGIGLGNEPLECHLTFTGACYFEVI